MKYSITNQLPAAATRLIVYSPAEQHRHRTTTNGMDNMFVDPERSFVATMTTNYGNLHIPQLTYGGRTRIKVFDYEPFSFESTFDVSNYLCARKEPTPEQLKFYFHCFDNHHYAIYLTTKGPYFFHSLSNEDNDFIGAFKVEDASTLYNLATPQGLITTLEHFDHDNPTIRIKTNEGSTLSVRGTTRVGHLVCTSNKSKQPVDFKLNILSRGLYEADR
ncbi:hypothetical protein ACYZT4_24875 [Pseudomonas sp. GB2N2]